MDTQSIRKIVIVGGGTAGWMTAAALSHFLDLSVTTITLIESDEIGTVGVGEATLPHLRFFNQRLGIDEKAFMRATNATYKMGIEFVNWGKIGESYLHPFADYGHEIEGVDFHHYWLKHRQQGNNSGLGEYSVGVMAALNDKFEFPSNDPGSLRSSFSYAYHIDATEYAKFLRQYAEDKGVNRIEGKVIDVKLHEQTGFIESVALEEGQSLDADLFVDCSGFKALLIGKALAVDYHDWSHWLPCDSAQAAACESAGNLTPYSRSTAREAGWQWRIPLQHRTGNGYVYSSHFIKDQQAQDTLLEHLEGKPLSDPIQLRFKTGKRAEVWQKNCVAIGLSSGFLEPLESTSIYLIQDTIDKLLEFFPTTKMEQAPIEEFNRLMSNEYERIRDFLILHYHLTRRNDSEFWEYCRSMSVPDSLRDKLALFKEQGHIVHYRDGLFFEPSWLAVYIGQGLVPMHYHPKLDGFDTNRLRQVMTNIPNDIARIVDSMESHEMTLARYLASDSSIVENNSAAAFSLYGQRR